MQKDCFYTLLTCVYHLKSCVYIQKYHQLHLTKLSLDLGKIVFYRRFNKQKAFDVVTYIKTDGQTGDNRP